MLLATWAEVGGALVVGVVAASLVALPSGRRGYSDPSFIVLPLGVPCSYGGCVGLMAGDQRDDGVDERHGGWVELWSTGVEIVDDVVRVHPLRLDLVVDVRVGGGDVVVVVGNWWLLLGRTSTL